MPDKLETRRCRLHKKETTMIVEGIANELIQDNWHQTA